MPDSISLTSRISTRSSASAKNTPTKAPPKNKRANEAEISEGSPKLNKRPRNANTLESPTRKRTTAPKKVIPIKPGLNVTKAAEESDSQQESEHQEDSEISDHHSDSSSDATEPEASDDEKEFYVARKIIKKKAVAKRKTVKGTPKSRTSKQKTTKVAKAKAATGVSESGINYECALYSEIIDEESSIETVADNWINTYCSVHEEAIVSFVNLTLRAAGCLGSIEISELCTRSDMEKSLDRLRVEINKSKVSFEPLVSSKTKADKVKLNQCIQFVKRIINNGSDVLIFGERDQEIDSSLKRYYFESSNNSQSRFSLFFSVIGSWLEVISMNEYRPFRQVGTLVIFNIQTAIAIIKKMVRDNLSTVRRQILEDENRIVAKNAKQSQKTSRRMQLDERESELLKQDKTLSERSDLILEKIIQFRYRDVYPPIRSECAVYISDWISKDPPSFLKTNYLRYFGWLWHDSDDKVRLASVENVRRIINMGSTVAPMLRSFFDRFGSRLLQLAVADSDSNVMVAALKLTVKVIENGMLITDETRVNSAISQIKSGRQEKPTEKKSKKAPKPKTPRKKNKRAALSQNFSQQLLYESDDSGESSGSEQNDSKVAPLLSSQKDQNDEEMEESSTGSNVLDLYDIIYSNDENNIDQDLYPLNKAIGYLAPLIVHSQASVRSAAGMLVYQWMVGTWVPAVVSKSQTNEESQTAGDPENEKEKELNEKWALYKSVASFLCLLESAASSKYGKTETGTENPLNNNEYCLSNDDITNTEKKWNEGRVFLKNLRFNENQKSNFAPEAEFGFGPNSSWVIASANSLYGKSAHFLDVDAILGYLSQDHSEVENFSELNIKSNLDSALLLSKEQEFALLRASLVWIGSQKAALIAKSKNSNSKSGISTINAQLHEFYKGFSNWVGVLMLRYRNQPQFLETLMAIAAYGLSTQVYFDLGKTADLEALVDQLLEVLERNKGSIAICQLVVHLLAKIDDSAVLDMSGTRIKASTASINIADDAMDVDSLSTSENANQDDSAKDELQLIKEPKVTSAVGTLLRKLVSQSVKDLYLNFSSDYIFNESSLLGPLINLRAILYDKDTIECMESANKGLGAGGILELEDDKNISPIFKKLLDLASEKPHFGLESDDNSHNPLVVVSSLSILLRMLVWKSHHVSMDLKLLEGRFFGNPELPPTNIETEPIINKARSLVAERDSFLKICGGYFKKEDANIHLKMTSLIISANTFVLFSSDFVRPVAIAQNSKSDIMASIDRMRENLILKVDAETQTSWVTSVNAIYNNWATTILPWAIFVYDFDKKKKAKASHNQKVKSIYSELLNSLPHNGLVVELAKSFSRLVINGVFPFTFIPKMAAYVGKLGSELIVREFEKKFAIELSSSRSQTDDNDGTIDEDGSLVKAAASAEKSKDSTNKASNSLKFSGFVALSSYDSTIQDLFNNLRVAATSENLQNYALRELMRSLQLSFELCVTNDLLLKQPGSQVYYRRQLSILPKVISAVLRSTSTGAIEIVAKTPSKTALSQFGLPIVCSLWATLHKAVIKYGFEIIEICCLEPLSSLVEEINQEHDKESDGQPSKEIRKNVLALKNAYDRCSLWYYVLSGVVNGLILPKHAHIIKETLQKEEEKQNTGEQKTAEPDDMAADDINKETNEVEPKESKEANDTVAQNPDKLEMASKAGDELKKECINVALQPYIKMLDEQINKYNTVKTRLQRNLNENLDSTDNQLSTPSKAFVSIESPRRNP